MPRRRRKSSKSARRAALLGWRNRRAKAARRSAAARKGHETRRRAHARFSAITTKGLKEGLVVNRKVASLIGRHWHFVIKALDGDKSVLNEFRGKGGRFSDVSGKRHVLETRLGRLRRLYESGQLNDPGYKKRRKAK